MSKRIRIVALCMLLALLASSMLTAFAEKPVPVVETLWAGSPFETSVSFEDGMPNIKISSIKSSNKSVLKAHKVDSTPLGMWVQPKKAGKATITITYTEGKSKKKQKVKTTVQVKKYPKPIKSLKVNGKKVSLTKYKYKYNYKLKKFKKLSDTITVEPKDGWHVNYIECIGDKDYFEAASGASFKIPKKQDMYCWIHLTNDNYEDFLYLVEYHRK